MVPAAFGPYLLQSPPLRLEHGIYLAALTSLFSTRKSLRLNPVFTAAVALWMAFAVLSMVLAVAPSRGIAGDGIGAPSVVSVADAMALPVAVAILVSLQLGRLKHGRVLVRISKWLATLAALNSLVALATLYLALEVAPWVEQWFWAPSAAVLGRSVGGEALELGRAGGIFNQPIEAGMAYSLALFSWQYYYRSDIGGRIARDGPILVGIVIGGLLSTSKVFLAVAIVMALYYGFASLLRHPGRSIKVLLASLGAVLALSALSPAGLDRLARGASGDLAVLSAGRYGAAQGATAAQERDVGEYVTGLGLTAWTEPLDNGYLASLLAGGIVTFGCYTGLGLLGLLHAKRLYSFRNGGDGNREAVFLLGVTAVFFVSSAGAFVPMLNRSATLFWVLYFVLLRIEPAWKRHFPCAGEKEGDEAAMAGLATNHGNRWP